MRKTEGIENKLNVSTPLHFKYIAYSNPQPNKETRIPMNKSALTTAFTSLSFRARILPAMRKTAILGHSVAHVVNRKGEPVLAVRYSAFKGFTYTSKTRNIPATEINNHLRAA